MARARSKSWHAAVAIAAKKIAEAEAAGLRAPMSDLHRRSAERLRELCARNAGVYVKLGQHLAQLDFVLPPEFIDVLRCMLDQVGKRATASGRGAVEGERGGEEGGEGEAMRVHERGGGGVGGECTGQGARDGRERNPILSISVNSLRRCSSMKPSSCVASRTPPPPRTSLLLASPPMEIENND